MEEQQKLELKILALKEGFRTKVASTVDEYEERIADLRIELTEQNQRLTAFDEENQRQQKVIVDLEQKIAELETGREKVVQEEDGTSAADSDDSD